MAQEWYGIPRWEVVHNGIDINKIKYQIIPRNKARSTFGLFQDDFVVLGVGRLNKIKRFDLLIEAFAILLKKQSNAKLLIAGDGKERKKLGRLVNKLKIGDSVKFLGNLDNVTELYCAADVLAVTSKSESSSLVAIEAQVCGLRCVLSAGVPQESIISTNTKRMEANATINDWSKALLDDNFEGKAVCVAFDYEVHAMSKRMKEVYLQYYREYRDRK
jgi:glycosyltransferase involved in cell wall biosynthesis